MTASEGQQAREERLSAAYFSVMELISYLSTEGDLPGDVATPEFFALLKKAQTGELTAEEEFSFWDGYSRIADHAKPIQVDALRFRSFLMGREEPDPTAKERYTKNRSNLKRIRFLCLFSFVGALMLLAYLAVTDGYMSSNNALDTEYKLIQAGYYEGTRLSQLADQNSGDALVVLRDQSNQSGNESGGEGDDDQVGSDPAISAEAARLRAASDRALREIAELVISNNNSLAFFQFGLSSPESAQEDLANVVLREKYSVKDLRLEAKQKAVNLLISTYLLPVFTSLLGVTVYMLRRVSSNLQSGQFRLYETGTYSYRVTLGIVGGIVISWFSRTDSSDVVSTLTPAALAFIVGYSIEVLFNVLDSIVKALGASDKEQT